MLVANGFEQFGSIPADLKPTTERRGADGLRGCDVETRQQKDVAKSEQDLVHGSPPITVSCSMGFRFQLLNPTPT